MNKKEPEECHEQQLSKTAGMQIPQPGGFIDNPYAQEPVEEPQPEEHQHGPHCAHAPKKEKQHGDRPKFKYNAVVLPLICLSSFVVLLLTGKM